MNEQLIQLSYFVLSYILIIVMGYLLINFLSNGFFSVFLKVKASRGKKILVEIQSFTDTYFKAGFIDDDFLVVKDRQKEQRRIVIKKACITRRYGVFVISIDEQTNNIIYPDSKKESGFDAKKFDSLFQRCLFKPQIKNVNDQLKTVILVIALIIAFAVIFYKLAKIQEYLKLIAVAIDTLNTVGVIN